MGLKRLKSYRGTSERTYLPWTAWRTQLLSGVMALKLGAPTWGLKRAGEGGDTKDPKKTRLLSDLLGGDAKEVNTASKLLIVLTKLALTNAAEISEITGMLWVTLLISADSPV
eukprot:3177991-Pyramimonas_sp.AAC.1